MTATRTVVTKKFTRWTLDGQLNSCDNRTNVRNRSERVMSGRIEAEQIEVNGVAAEQGSAVTVTTADLVQFVMSLSEDQVEKIIRRLPELTSLLEV